jgi:Rhodopirellula transposase DDE domain
VARAAGDGGVTAVAEAAGASWQTVADGAEELASGDDAGPGRVRRPGGGRKKLEEHDPRLTAALAGLMEESTRGDPQSLLLWTTLPVRGIAGELTRRGHPCGKGVVLRMLHAAGFSLQGNSRTIEGSRHPDRDAQFRYISDAAKEFLAAGDPVISIDTKKKELVGQYAQKGTEWRAKGDPRRVRDHDFPDPGGGKAIPYGVYDIGANAGFVNVGTDHDTAAFAAGSVRRWWDAIGRDRYPACRGCWSPATRAARTATAPGPGKRSWRGSRPGPGPGITCCRFPPGTSKWNKIEHRLFCPITRTWRGRPLTSYQVVVNTIAATTTATGLRVTAVLDAGRYPPAPR